MGLLFAGLIFCFYLFVYLSNSVVYCFGVICLLLKQCAFILIKAFFESGGFIRRGVLKGLFGIRRYIGKNGIIKRV